MWCSYVYAGPSVQIIIKDGILLSGRTSLDRRRRADDDEMVQRPFFSSCHLRRIIPLICAAPRRGHVGSSLMDSGHAQVDKEERVGK